MAGAENGEKPFCQQTALNRQIYGKSPRKKRIFFTVYGGSSVESGFEPGTSCPEDGTLPL
ncbi:hypothetical protein AVEN_8832-1, partial [Araneus ventricosus]